LKRSNSAGSKCEPWRITRRPAIAAFLHAPKVVLFDEVQFRRALLDLNLRDIVDRKIGK
jgi:hypothetical protein